MRQVHCGFVRLVYYPEMVVVATTNDICFNDTASSVKSTIEISTALVTKRCVAAASSVTTPKIVQKCICKSVNTIKGHIYYEYIHHLSTYLWTRILKQLNTLNKIKFSPIDIRWVGILYKVFWYQINGLEFSRSVLTQCTAMYNILHIFYSLCTDLCVFVLIVYWGYHSVSAHCRLFSDNTTSSCLLTLLTPPSKTCAILFMSEQGLIPWKKTLRNVFTHWLITCSVVTGKLPQSNTRHCQCTA